MQGNHHGFPQPVPEIGKGPLTPKSMQMLSLEGAVRAAQWSPRTLAWCG